MAKNLKDLVARLKSALVMGATAATGKIGQKINQITPGGVAGGAQRVMESLKPENRAQYNVFKTPEFERLGIQPLKGAVEGIKGLNYSPYLASKGKQAPPNLRDSFTNLSKVAKGVGATVLGPAGTIISAGIGAATNPQNRYEGAMEGIELGQQYGGLTKFTSPLISKVIPKAGGATSRVLQGAASVGENVLQNIVTKRPTSPGEAALSFITGATGKPFQTKTTTKNLVENEGFTKAGDVINAKTPEEILKSAREHIVVGAKENKKSIKQNIKDFYTDWVNRFQPIEDVANAIEKTGQKIASVADPRIAIKRLMGAGGVAELRHKKELDPILNELGDIDKGDFDAFLEAKRNLGFASVGREILGSDPVQAQGVVDALSSKYDVSKLEAVAQKLYSYQDKGLQMLADAGFIGKEGLEKVKSNNPDYVPFQRVMDELDNYLGLPTNKAAQGTNVIQKIKGSNRKIYSPLESIIANTYKAEAAIAKNRVAKTLVGLTQGNPTLESIFTPTRKAGTNTIPVWENGKKLNYEAPEDIVRAIKGLNEESAGTLTKILSLPAQILRQGATGRNIDFMIPNVFKDQFDAAINTKHGYIPFVDYLLGLGHLAKNDMGGGDELVEQWIKSGGQMSFDMMGGRKAINEQISDAAPQRLTAKLTKFLTSGLDTVGRYSEVPTRLGAFRRALKATGDPLEAAMESRESTLDFSRMGAKMKTANSIIPFLNVGVQGFDKLARTAKRNPGQFVMRLGMYAIGPQAAISLYNNKYHPEEYSEIPQYIKDTNFVLVNGRDEEGRPTYFTFPKGNIVPMAANPVDSFISYLHGTNQESFQSLALNMLGDVLPVVEGGDTLRDVASRTVGSNLPQFAKPLVEDVANHSFFKNQPIVPSYMQSKAPEEQVKKNTEGLYKYIGGVMNASPLKVENFLEGSLAGFAKTPTNLWETAKEASSGEPIDPNKIPVLRRFYGEGNTPEETIKFRAMDEEKKAKQTVQAENTKPFLQRLFPSSDASASEKVVTNKKQSPALIKARESAAREKVSATGEIQETDQKVFYLNENNEVASVFKDRPITKPKLTGDAATDKKLMSSYKSDITVKQNDIIKLLEIGKLTEEEAISKIKELDTLKSSGSSGSTKSKKKITISTRKTPTYKFKAGISKKPATLKLKKAPSLKLKKSKPKSIKLSFGKVPVVKASKFKNTLTQGFTKLV